MAVLFNDTDFRNRYSKKPEEYFDMLAEADIEICLTNGSAITPKQLLNQIGAIASIWDTCRFLIEFPNHAPFTPSFCEVTIHDGFTFYVDCGGGEHKINKKAATMITEVIIGFYKRQKEGIDHAQ